MFEELTAPSNLGYYNCFECISIFVIDKDNECTINIYSLYIAEERYDIEFDKEEYLTSKLISISKKYSLGITRTFRRIEDMKKIYINLNSHANRNKSGSLDLGFGGSILLGRMETCEHRFVPCDGTKKIPLNSILKNNKNGSNIIEFFDVEKDFHFNEKEWMKTIENIYKVIPIDLQSVRDRFGNIIFQFPSQILFPVFEPKIDGVFNPERVKATFRIDPRSNEKRYTVSLISKSDGIITGYVSKTISELKSDTCMLFEGINSFDETSFIIQDNDSLLINYCCSLSLIENISVGLTVNSGIMRKVKDDVIPISQMCGNVETPQPEQALYRKHINKRTYSARLNALEKTHAFSHYSYKDGLGDEHLHALKDIREIINRERKSISRICLWDPYLSANDIVDTLFYFELSSVPMMAISSTRSSELERRIAQDNSDYEQWKTEQIKLLDNADSTGINLEFRCQHSDKGFKFHDRFLIICYHHKHPSAWSLGKSVNAIGKDHHIIQEVEHSGYILEAFDLLWNELYDDSCLVWKQVN